MLKQDVFIVAGRLARYTGGGVVSQALTPWDNVRVVLSHEIPTENMRQYRGIVSYLCAQRRVITPAEFFSHYSANGDRAPISGRSVLFTFDDGLLSSYHAARQVLDPLAIKAIFFVPTQILELEHEEEMRSFAWEQIHNRQCPIERLRPEEYQTMSGRELLALHRQGHAIFPHTHSHLRISEITTPEDVDAELRRPRLILEELLQTPCDAFAFPDGSERAISAYSLHAVGQTYDYCFWALAGANTEKTHPLLLHRDSIHPWHSLGHVRSIVGGSYDAYHGLRQRRIARHVDLPARPFHGRTTKPPASASSARRAFVECVGRELDAAGVEYVFLHGYEHDHDVDSDLDIAVTRRDVALVDTIVRTGVFGRLVQCLHYAEPWCRYYVMSANEPGRSCRELDVACDPWGIGKDGPALSVALAHSIEANGLQTCSPGAQTLYLAVKKARKRQTDDRTRDLLLRAYARDPRESAELLEHHLGRAGRDLARALEAGQWTVRDELEAVRRRLRRRWLSPSLVVRRASFAAWRATGRVLHPTGLVVGITAPDGAGKSTLTANLELAAGGRFRRFRRYHLRPGLLPPPAALLRRTPPSGDEPHGKTPSGLGGSLLRLLYLWLDNVIAWIPKVTIPKICTTLVVIERGWHDLFVDPNRYRLSSPRLVTRLFGRLLPRPALVLSLDAPPATLAQRTADLDVGEIDRQLECWRSLAAADPARFRTIDASRPPAEILDQALEAIDDHLATRQRDLRPCELALACLGPLHAQGTSYRIISATRGPLGREPRWLMPSRRGAPGPRGAQLFRPARQRHRAPALVLELVQRLGLRPVGTRVTVATEGGIGPAIAALLGLPDVELGAAVTGDPSRGARALISISRGGRLVAFAKVAREEGAKLEHERRVLDLLAACDLQTLVVPEALGLLEWRDCRILVLRPFKVRHPVNRRLGRTELWGLAELAKLTEPLAPVLGERPGLVPIHGDFTPWNSAADGARLMTWDWEEARLGLPLEDLFYWRLQRLFHFSSGTVRDLVRAAFEPAEDVRLLCDALSVPPAAAPEALRVCLEQTLEARRRTAHAGPQWAAAVQVLEAALSELAKAEADR